MDKNKILRGFEGAKNKARKLIEDPEKVTKIIAQSKEKLPDLKGPLEKAWEDVHLLIAMSKAYMNGKYKEIPVGSIAAIIGGLLYMLSPIDVIPDFIPVAGLVDDAFVLTIVLQQLQSDLEKYKKWRNVAEIKDDFSI
ncbi:MAG: YkvA family protein [Desulfitobacteriaceae bacterium]